MVEADQEKVINALKAVGEGSFLRGWRVELDPDGSLDVNFLEFCRACKKLRVAVDAAALFGEDSPNELTLDELAPEEGALVYRFRSWLSEKFGSPGEMFAVVETPDGDGRMDRQEFINGMIKHGFECSTEHLSELFNLLDLFCVGSVAMEDIMFLEMDPKTRQGAIEKVKMRSKIEHEHFLTELYREMKRMELRSGHRLAPRLWHAPQLERLPEVVIEKRLKWKKKVAVHRKEVIAAFMRHLIAGYGNGVRAWRRGLDPKATFVLHRADLLQYCRKLNMDIDTSTLWTVLDRDCDEALRLEEITPQAAASLARFWKWARTQFDSCAKGWGAFMVAAKPPSTWKSSSSLQSAAFMRAIKALNWPGANEPGAGPALVSALDLNGCGIVSKGDLEWLDKWEAPEWLCCPPDPQAWIELSKLLLRKYGNPLRAWRVLDEDDSNMVSWDEFDLMCNKVHFRGNRGGAWRVLDGDISGTISMEEWHPASAKLLKSFKDWLDATFGSVKFAFETIDTDGSGALTYSELRRACRRLKWSGDVRHIFQCLNIEMTAGDRTLSYKELAFLDSWEPSIEEEEEEPFWVVKKEKPKGIKRSASCPGIAGGAVGGAALASAPASPAGGAGLPSVAPGRSPKARPERPARPEKPRMGVGMLREQTLAAMRAKVERMQKRERELDLEHKEIRAEAERLKTPGALLPPLSGRSQATADEEDQGHADGLDASWGWKEFHKSDSSEWALA